MYAMGGGRGMRSRKSPYVNLLLCFLYSFTSVYLSNISFYFFFQTKKSKRKKKARNLQIPHISVIIPLRHVCRTILSLLLLLLLIYQPDFTEMNPNKHFWIKRELISSSLYSTFLLFLFFLLQVSPFQDILDG